MALVSLSRDSTAEVPVSHSSNYSAEGCLHVTWQTSFFHLRHVRRLLGPSWRHRQPRRRICALTTWLLQRSARRAAGRDHPWRHCNESSTPLLDWSTVCVYETMSQLCPQHHLDSPFKVNQACRCLHQSNRRIRVPILMINTVAFIQRTKAPIYYLRNDRINRKSHMRFRLVPNQRP